MVLGTEWAQVEVIDLYNDGTGLAFGIVGGRSSGVIIKTILPGGVADRDGRLQSGDHILQIGEVNLRGFGSDQVAAVLRQCGIHVRLVVARPVDSSGLRIDSTTAAIVPTKILGDPVELERHLILSNDTNIDAIIPYHFRQPPEIESFTVTLIKTNDLGIGITVAGYVCEPEDISGIFVKSVTPGSAADNCSHRIQANDRIIEVNNVSIIGRTNHQAVDVLKSTGDEVSIRFERYLRGPKYEQLQQAIQANESPIVSCATTMTTDIMSLPKVSFSQIPLLISEDRQSLTTSIDSGILPADGVAEDETEIVLNGDGNYQIDIQQEDAICTKWLQQLPTYKNVKIIVARMTADNNNQHLGISLEGTVDVVENGRELHPHHYIRNILPDGLIGRDGRLQPADELLEVNGIALLGLNHLDVVSVLRQLSLSSTVCFVCARYLTEPPQNVKSAFQARNILPPSLVDSLMMMKRYKAKSELSLVSSAGTAMTERSRSLETIADNLPQWSQNPIEIELIKGDYGLGFSILDYQDPICAQQTVIVVRSLVIGGVAYLNGKLKAGDRLISVNGVDIERAPLDRAVQVLKHAPRGVVKLQVTKPLDPEANQSSTTSQDTETDDATCTDDFHECLEEYDDCLDAVHISFDEEITEDTTTTSYEHSSLLAELQFPVKLKETNNNHLDCYETYTADDSVSLDNTIRESPLLALVATPINDEENLKISRRVYYNDYNTDEMMFFDQDNRSCSAPDIMDGSFVKITYDPGPVNTMSRSDYDLNSISSSNFAMTVNCDEETMVENVMNKHWGSLHKILVQREPNSSSLGLSIVGGKVDIVGNGEKTSRVLGIFVKNVVKDSPAGRTEQFKIGDRILEVGGVDLRSATHEFAVRTIRNASDPVEFLIQSLVPWSSDDNDSNIMTHTSTTPSLQKEEEEEAEEEEEDDEEQEKEEETTTPDIVITTTATTTPNDDEQENEAVSMENQQIQDTVSLVISEVDNDEALAPVQSDEDEDEDDDDDEEDSRDMEGRTFSSKGRPIDRASAGNLRRSKEDICKDAEEEDDFGYTTDKVRTKYAPLGHPVILVQLERGPNGLGLSLAGHKDRNCMAVLVCGLNPVGAAYKSGAIQIGDEILEVNGVVLQGRCHLNASAIIKGLPGPNFKIIVLRRKSALEDLAVKPITEFPVSVTEEVGEEQFSGSYPNVRTVTIQKGAHNLGIMIIEGRHADIGQGIFISDIQEGGAAQQAGLEIGEMLLAVNKESFVGYDFDTATNILKRTEGLVQMVVSNPSKRAPLTTQPAVGPSRPSTPIPEVSDPATCQIVPGRDVTIEILTDNKHLGVFYVGGKDTLLKDGVVIVDVYEMGRAALDGRLRAGDQILEVQGVCLRDVTNQTAGQSLRQLLPKVKLVIYRNEPVQYVPIEVNLMRKGAKGLGLSVAVNKRRKVAYISDIVHGGLADVDGRICRGDQIVSVNGDEMDGDQVGAILKTALGKIHLKLHRYKLAK